MPRPTQFSTSNNSRNSRNSRSSRSSRSSRNTTHSFEQSIQTGQSNSRRTRANRTEGSDAVHSDRVTRRTIRRPTHTNGNSSQTNNQRIRVRVRFEPPSGRFDGPDLPGFVVHSSSESEQSFSESSNSMSQDKSSSEESSCEDDSDSEENDKELEEESDDDCSDTGSECSMDFSLIYNTNYDTHCQPSLETQKKERIRKAKISIPSELGDIPQHVLQTIEQKWPSIAQSFECPISGSIMKFPVMANDGHTYELDQILKWFCSPQTDESYESGILEDSNLYLRKLTSPVTNMRLWTPKLLPNYQMRSTMQALYAASSPD